MPNLRDRPTPGFHYKVIRGDSSNNVERAAYGYVTGIIEKANPFINGRNSGPDGRQFLYPNDIIFLPANTEKEKLKTAQAEKQLSGKSNDELTIIINNREIKYMSARVIRTMDTPADSWTARISWEPGKDSELDAILVPYSYHKASVYIGNQLLINGILYGIQTEENDSGVIVTLEGFSFSADIIDSTMPTPYEAKKITLLDRANQILQHIGITAEYDTGIIDGGQFDRVTGEAQDTIFNHLKSLASQRGLLVSSTPEGNILFLKTTDKPTVGTIERFLSLGAKYDGRLLYNQITAIGESPGSTSKKATVNDDNIPRSRFITITADDSTDGNIEKAAEWRRTKQYADALSIPVPVAGWYAPDGNLWRENTKVTLKNKTIFVPNGYDFLIKSVEYVIESSGRTATLSLVPPEVFTGERIILPWQVES